MVLYIASGDTQVCNIAIQPQHRTHVLNVFPRMFQERMASTLRFLQAYQNAARHSTPLRFHYSQTQDLSNVTPQHATQFFPYEIFPVELTSDLLKPLAQNPAHLLTAMTGIQPIIHQATQDQGMEYSSFGKSGKGKIEPGTTIKPKAPLTHGGKLLILGNSQQEEAWITQVTWPP